MNTIFLPFVIFFLLFSLFVSSLLALFSLFYIVIISFSCIYQMFFFILHNFLLPLLLTLLPPHHPGSVFQVTFKVVVRVPGFSFCLTFPLSFPFTFSLPFQVRLTHPLSTLTHCLTCKLRQVSVCVCVCVESQCVCVCV